VPELVEKIDRVTPQMLADIARKTFASKPSLATVGPASNIATLEVIQNRLAV
jgi:predicted Zn-dependent peptidase